MSQEHAEQSNARRDLERIGAQREGKRSDSSDLHEEKGRLDTGISSTVYRSAKESHHRTETGENRTDAGCTKRNRGKSI